MNEFLARAQKMRLKDSFGVGNTGLVSTWWASRAGRLTNRLWDVGDDLLVHFVHVVSHLRHGLDDDEPSLRLVFGFPCRWVLLLGRQVEVEWLRFQLHRDWFKQTWIPIAFRRRTEIMLVHGYLPRWTLAWARSNSGRGTFVRRRTSPSEHGTWRQLDDGRHGRAQRLSFGPRRGVCSRSVGPGTCPQSWPEHIVKFEGT